MKRLPTLGAVSGTMLIIAACASMAEQQKPALSIEPTAESHAELVHVVSGALNIETVRLAEDALTRDSLLVIERTPARDASGQRLSGRDFGQPEQFQLVTDGRGCALIHLRTGKRYVLAKLTCKAI